MHSNARRHKRGHLHSMIRLQPSPTGPMSDLAGQHRQLLGGIIDSARCSSEHATRRHSHRLRPLAGRHRRHRWRHQRTRHRAPSQLLQRKHRLPPMRPNHRVRPGSDSRLVARHSTRLDHRHPDKEPVLTSPHGTAATRLGRRNSLPRRRACNRSSHAVRRKQHLIPCRVVEPLIAALQRRTPCLSRDKTSPRPRVEVTKHRTGIVLVEPDWLANNHHGHDDPLRRTPNHSPNHTLPARFARFRLVRLRGRASRAYAVAGGRTSSDPTARATCEECR